MPVSFGTRIAAKIPRITSTSNSSISVKPRVRRTFVLLFITLLPSRKTDFTAETQRAQRPSLEDLHSSAARIFLFPSPRSLRLRGDYLFLFHQVLQHEHRQQHADHDRADDGGHDDQQQGLGEGDERAELPFEVALV